MVDQLTSTMQFQNQRRLAAQLKLRETEPSIGLPISARRQAQRDAILTQPVGDENAEDGEPDSEQVMRWLVEMWPQWDTFSGFKQSILYGVVDYLLYHKHDIPPLIPHIAQVVKETSLDALPLSGQRGSLGEAGYISALVTTILGMAHPVTPWRIPTSRPRARPPTLQGGACTDRPRLGFNGLRVAPVMDRTKPSPGDGSARMATPSYEQA
jgi:hypothetical protein